MLGGATCPLFSIYLWDSMVKTKQKKTQQTDLNGSEKWLVGSGSFGGAFVTESAEFAKVS